MRTPTTSPRRGFTLVELLVVIAIIGTLVALLIPAVNAARQRAYQTQCSNNMRNLGQALINFSTGNSSGTLPGYVQPVLRNDKTYVEWRGVGANPPRMGESCYSSTTIPDPEDARLRSRVSWAVRILPQLERQDLWDRIVDGNGFPGLTPPEQEQNLVRPIEMFICPADSDATSNPDNAALTYVVNTGAWDWAVPISDNFGPDDYLLNETPPPPAGDTKDNGLFQNLTMGNNNNRITVKDGASTTLMLGENRHKDEDYSWFGVAFDQGGEQQFGMVWVSDTSPSPGATELNQVPFGQEVTPPTGFPDSGPWYCRPASNHPAGSFNVMFLDSHVSSMEPNLDYIVYQQLMTTNGAKCVDSKDNTAYLMQPNGAIYQFRTAPPISESDFQ
jgi:prepilin-type N-terminal cleavage/methylation domain-containing protein